HLDRNARLQPRLSRDVHAGTRLEDATHHDVAPIGRLYSRARDRLANHDRTKIDGAEVFECAAECADRRTARAENYCLEVFVHVEIIVLRSRDAGGCMLSRPRARSSSIWLRAVVCSSLLLAIAGSAPTAQSKRPMTIDDAIDLVQVSSPRISPDGRRLLYTVSELGKWKDNKRVP